MWVAGLKTYLSQQLSSLSKQQAEFLFEYQLLEAPFCFDTYHLFQFRSIQSYYMYRVDTKFHSSISRNFVCPKGWKRHFVLNIIIYYFRPLYTKLLYCMYRADTKFQNWISRNFSLEDFAKFRNIVILKNVLKCCNTNFVENSKEKKMSNVTFFIYSARIHSTQMWNNVAINTHLLF
jgi:hypothetical protein